MPPIREMTGLEASVSIMPLERWSNDMGLVRKGECRRCGRCCAGKVGVCPHFRWKAVETIPRGTEIEHTGTGTSLEAVCLIHGNDDAYRYCTLETRKNFPSLPTQVTGDCGFRFETPDGRKLTVKDGQIWIEE